MIASKAKSLSILPDSTFLRQLEKLVTKEKRVGLQILRYLIEMDRRELYANMGYSSLFDFCVRHLRYSESDANRKIKAARCIRDFPEVGVLLGKNELDMCKIALIANTISKENKSELLKNIRYKSCRQIQEIIARHNPGSLLHDKIRPVFVKQSAPVSSGTVRQVENAADKKATANVGGKKLASSVEPQTVLEKKFRLEFAVSPEVMAKIEQVKTLLSNKYPKGAALEQVLDALLDDYIEKHDPRRRRQRREKRLSKNKSAGKTFKEPAAGRHIPTDTRDKVFDKYNGKCSYVSPNGVKCKSDYNIHIDHIVPYAKGGDHSLSNLRLLCGKHNRLEAERVFGREYINNKIARGKGPRRE